MTVQINNYHPLTGYGIWLQRTAAWLLREFGLQDHDLSITLLTDDEIQRYNDTYRQKNIPTNVLSFPFSEGNGIEPLPEVKEVGDILISMDTALREADRYQQTLRARLSWLLVHGFLHLIGYDHERSSAAEKEMLTKEKELLQRLQIERSKQMTHLAINVDHVATIRQARGIAEPDPVTAASICELSGASGIVVHLREDRRHIQDRDVYLLRETVKTKLNLEMGATKEIIKIALDVRPDMITLVPEKRQELTTEGGLDVLGQKKKIAKTIEKMTQANIPVSIFVDPDERQIQACKDIGATFVEVHTGRYCDATSEVKQDEEFQLIAMAADSAYHLGLRVNAGHGLDFHNTARIAALDTIEELSIGHAIISRAVFSGLDNAVREMNTIIKNSSMGL